MSDTWRADQDPIPVLVMAEMDHGEVLIVGAGPVGLTLAIDLAWRGINVTVIEKRAAAEPPEPKCNHVAARSMEIFRRLGLAEKVRNAGLPADYPHDISYRTTFTGCELTRIPIPCRRDRFTSKHGPDCNWPTPEPPHRINQIFLEPILFEHAAAQARIHIVNRALVEDVSIDDDSVSVVVRDLETGSARRASYRYSSVATARDPSSARRLAPSLSETRSCSACSRPISARPTSFAARTASAPGAPALSTRAVPGWSTPSTDANDG
jgi:hypothetical protein